MDTASSIQQQRSEAVAAMWLAAVHSHPDRVVQEWRHHDAAFLPTGRSWDVVKLSEAAVHAVTQGNAPDQLRAFFAELGLLGPAFVSHRRIYLLVPPGTAETWKAFNSECLGNGYLLPVPRVTSVEGSDMHWLLPPDGTGELCSPAAVRALVEILGPSADHGEVLP